MLKKTLVLIALFCSPGTQLFAVSPKLVVVVSLDQFRYDYIARFKPHFGKRGFNYFLENGANFTNASYKHAATSTGPGHAAMLSGTYGNSNGIVANDWFNRDTHKGVYCVRDTSVSLVGSRGEGRSPRNFIGSTFGDELRLNSGFHSKVISVSNKDRAAILMAGKIPSGVFWMADSVFVTSTYYMEALPAWVTRFNQSRFIDSFFGKVWNKKLPNAAYKLMDDDDVPYEADHDGSGRTFPHVIVGLDKTKITPSYYWSLARSPFNAVVLKEFAKRAIDAEQLGQRGNMDMLCVSFSSTDIIGHAYGPHSHEVMDMALQMDSILADLLSFIDRRVGLKNCVLVLTSDHGVAPIPEYIKKKNPNADAGRVGYRDLKNFCSTILTKRFGEPKNGALWIEAVSSNNIYLDCSTLAQMNVPSLEVAAKELADSLGTHPAIAAAYASHVLSTMTATSPIEGKLKRSFQKLRSGDVIYALKPYWTESDTPQGASHGEPYDYDAHVPVVIVGRGVRKGNYATEASPIDIAPTLSALLGVEFPAGRDGRVLVEAFK